MSIKKSSTPLVTFIISFLIVGSIAFLFLYPEKESTPTNNEDTTTTQANDKESNKTNTATPTNISTPREEIEKPGVEPVKFIDLKSSQSLAYAIAKIIQDRNVKALEHLLSQQVITEDQAKALTELISNNSAKLATPSVTSIGANNQGAAPTARYSLNFKNGARGYLDLKQGANQQWKLDKLNLPTKEDINKEKATPLMLNDPMGVVSAFMEAVITTNFKTARKLVDREKVKDATIAGLCILFEEGAFRLRDETPIKTAYEAPSNAGFFVHLQDAQGKKAGNVGITVAKKDTQWLIAEVSLDSMLEAYTKRQGAGDDIFIPIVKNPQGGDSLALFFGFNEDTLSPRSVRQLEIVANIIRLDDKKNLEISGHTDDVGSERYNQGLSERRANAVKKQLVTFGVPAERIITKGFGKSQPRRTWSNTDDEKTRDDVRRENRRAEMYLDF